MKLLKLDWLDLNFWNQENLLMSPDGVCAISMSLAGDETSVAIGIWGSTYFFLPTIFFKNKLFIIFMLHNIKDPINSGGLYCPDPCFRYLVAPF